MSPTPNTLKILAVDDTRSNLLLLKALLGEFGHTIVTAADGVQAIEAFRKENPDVILMDVMMPNMDGIEAARHIRELNRVVPILFLSADTDAHSIERALQIGTDYITKPIQPQQLLDKLKAHFRSVLANREILEQKQEVQRLHDQLLDENMVAAHVLSRMLSRMVPPGDLIQYSVVPTSMFSGDLVLAGTTPSGRLHVILADAIGHGLPAAFTLLPLIPPFNAMTNKGFPLQDILFEINKTLKSVMPVGRFIAATAVSVDQRSGAAEFWVGGNPAVLIRGRQGLRRIASSHLALGLTEPDNKVAFTCESVQLDADDSVVFFSDGLLETWQDGNLEDFIAAAAPDEIFARVQETAKRHQGHDDTSLVVLRVGELAPEQAPAAAAPMRSRARRLRLDLDVRQMAESCIVHTIIDMARKLGIVAHDDGLFSMVLTELYSNALDHGVLGLSSELKYAGADGFDAYIQQREERLASLVNGYIGIQIEASEFAGQAATLLRIVDSGAGFDQALLRGEADSAEEASAGRGIKLAMNTCLKLSFAGSGNDVTAYIPRAGCVAPGLPPELPPYYAADI